jgi:hypothetical protein
MLHSPNNMQKVKLKLSLSILCTLTLVEVSGILCNLVTTPTLKNPGTPKEEDEWTPGLL